MATVNSVSKSSYLATGQPAGFVPQIWLNRALTIFHQNCVMPKLVNRNYENDFRSKGDTVNIPKMGTLSVNDKVAGQTVTLQQPEGTTVQITLAYHQEVSFLIEDVIASQSAVDLMDGLITEGMIKMANKVDLALLGLYSGVDAGMVVGSGSSQITEDNVVKARYLLNQSEVPYTDRAMVVRDYAPLLKIDRFTRADMLGTQSAIPTGLVGSLHGLPSYEDPRVILDTGSPATLHNLIFHKQGLALASRPLPLPPAGLGVRASYRVMDGVGMRLLYGYNMDALGTQVTLDMLYGVKLVRTDSVVDLQSAAIY